MLNNEAESPGMLIKAPPVLVEGENPPINRKIQLYLSLQSIQIKMHFRFEKIFLLVVVIFQVNVVIAKTIPVSNTEEFFNALGPGNSIQINCPIIDLHSFALKKSNLDREPYKSEYYTINYQSFISEGDIITSVEFEIELKNIDRMKIFAGPGIDSTVWIVSSSWHGNVLNMKSCKNIVLQGLTFGHYPEPGYCTGNVLKFDSCNFISINQCSLFGSGLTGLIAENTDHLSLSKTTIRDCSENILYLSNCDDAKFTSCSFINTPGDLQLNYSLEMQDFKTAQFTKCTFAQLTPEYNFISCNCSGGNGACSSFSECSFDKEIEKALGSNWQSNYILTKSKFNGSLYSNKVKKVPIEN